MQHAGKHDVIDIVTLAANEPWVFLALDAAVPDRAVCITGRRVGRVFHGDGHASTSIRCF